MKKYRREKMYENKPFEHIAYLMSEGDKFTKAFEKVTGKEAYEVTMFVGKNVNGLLGGKKHIDGKPNLVAKFIYDIIKKEWYKPSTYTSLKHKKLTRAARAFIDLSKFIENKDNVNPHHDVLNIMTVLASRIDEGSKNAADIIYNEMGESITGKKFIDF